MTEDTFEWNTPESEPQDTISKSSEMDTSVNTKDRKQFAMYLSDRLTNEILTRYKRMNAERILDDKQEIEKNKHFYTALIRAGLDNPQLSEYVTKEVERY
jgi:hypothetical protein